MTMNAESNTPPAKSARTGESRSTNPTDPKFEAPGPGTWMLDAAHCERPRTTYMNALFAPLYTEGFRRGFERYGALLDTIEYRPIANYPFTAVRPLGAPPDAKGTPPKWIFKTLVALHPALRKRCKRARVVMETRVWKEDIESFWRELPDEEARIAALAAEPLEALDTNGLIDHVRRTHALCEHRIQSHFERAPATMVPVGDFVAHVRAWTGAGGGEILGALRGSSPASIGGTSALEAAADAIRNEPAARVVLTEDRPAADVINALRASAGSVGVAVSRLLDRYGDVVFSGHDLSELSLREMPDVLVVTLRARVDAPTAATNAREAAEASAAALREKVPAESRALFDDLLAEARAAYPLRDARGGVDFWALGVLRRALREVGRRLAASGRIEREDDVFDFDPSELLEALTGAGGPSAADLASRARWRRTGKVEEAPAFVGPPPGAPPPAEWLPAGAARAARAVGTYIEFITTEAQGAAARDGVITGLGAASGRRTGRARLVRSAADFGRLRSGDILVAPITTPAYNVILPLLGGVVTDRGGLLSHPAIVSREYGFPGVVGTKNATSRIPDGALVEIDGDAGTVKVLG